MSIAIEPRYLKLSTAQAYLNCSDACIKRLVKDSYLTLKYIPMVRQPRIDKEEIDRLMKGQDIEAIKELTADDMINEFLKTQ